MACSRGITRPEHVAVNGRDYYDVNEAHRYDSTLITNIIQKELTLKAIQLLGIQARLLNKQHLRITSKHFFN